jgi:hypothetical protein
MVSSSGCGGEDAEEFVVVEERRRRRLGCAEQRVGCG